MATIREKRPGVFDLPEFVGRDAHGRPKQVSRTVHGTIKDAQVSGGQYETVSLNGVAASLRHFIVTGYNREDVWLDSGGIPVMRNLASERQSATSSRSPCST